ncbi:phage tail sheath family protein [Streptomyces populi]
MATLPTYPGVYVEELPSSVRTITAVTTSVCAFVGRTRRGPLNSAVTVTSFADFERRFGGLDPDGVLGHSVRQFFLNGGSVAVVVRVDSGSGSSAAVRLSSAEITPAAAVLEITAKEPGTWGSGLRVSVDYDTEDPEKTYNLRVFDSSGAVQESFTGLGTAESDPRSADSMVNSSSAVIRIEVLNRDGRPNPVGTVSKKFDSVPTADVLSRDVDVKIGEKSHTFKIYDQEKDGDTAPATVTALALLLERKLRALPDLPGKRVFAGARVTAFGRRLQVVAGSDSPDDLVRFTGENANDLGLEGSVNPPVFLLEGGADGGAPGAADLIGSEAGKTGIHALRAVQDVNLLALPELAGYDSTDDMLAVISAADALCREKRMFLLVDAPAHWTDIDAARVGRADFDVVRSDHAALYFPQVEVVDPLTGRLRGFPPSGTVAGIMARTDSERGVWKAPAGTEALLNGVRSLTVPMTDRENGLLNPVAVNCLRTFPVVGPVVWGARTLDGSDALGSQWKYVPVRRLALMVEESLYRGTQWVVFEPNDERLWAQIRLNAGAFLHTLFRQGAFQGTSPREAYFVKVDKDTTTQDDVNRGVVNIAVGFAPLKPAEFVIVKIEQMAGQVLT